MSEDMLSKFEIIDEKIKQIVYSMNACDLDVNNTFTKFLKISENKFTENVINLLNFVRKWLNLLEKT